MTAHYRRVIVVVVEPVEKQRVEAAGAWRSLRVGLVAEVRLDRAVSGQLARRRRLIGTTGCCASVGRYRKRRMGSHAFRVHHRDS